MTDEIILHSFDGLTIGEFKFVNSDGLPAGAHQSVIRDVLDLKNKEWAVKFEFPDFVGNDGRPIIAWQKFNKDGMAKLHQTFRD